MLSVVERERRIRQLTRYLVRTINGCPAPGIAPFTAHDWLIIAAVLGPAMLLVLFLASASPR